VKVDSTFLIEGFEPAEQSDTHLRLGAFEPRSLVAGPGTRAVLWVTGCNRRCPGCIKPEFLPFHVGEWIRTEDVASKILSIKMITGVSYSGGEPFEQTNALGKLSRLLKAHGLDVLAYSGYTLEALQKDPARFSNLLEQIDFLIDGEFQLKLSGPRKYLGSDNQRLLQRQIDGSFAPVETLSQRDVQITLRQDDLRLTGFPNDDFQRSLKVALASRGIVLRADDE
jgi:anaerobic ribonucleoside-triphosphate reductase activating protein